MYLLYNKSFISSRRFSFLSRVLLNRLNASSLVIFFVSIIICVILFMPQRYVLFPNSPNNSPLFCENQQSTINHQQPSLCAAAPSAHKHSRLCCVGTHEQPHRGESLFARTGPAGQALSPHLLRRGKSWLSESNVKCIWTLPSVKDFGEAKVFRRGCGTSPSRRGRVR